MQHPDPADLAVLALGDHLDEDGLYEHVVECDRCSAELADLRLVVTQASTENGPGRGPSPEVWAAILAEVGPEFDALPGAGRVAPTPADPVHVGAAEDSSMLHGSAGPVDPSAAQGVRRDDIAARRARPSTDRPAGRAGFGDAPRLSQSPVVPLPSAGVSEGSSTDRPVDGSASAAVPIRRSRWVPLVAAAAVGLLVGGGVVALVARDAADPPVPPEVLASTALTPVPGGQLGNETGKDFGVAEVVAAEGTQWVKVSGAALPETTDAYEVWLIGEDNRMVSLGALHDGQGTFTIPAGIDYTRFPVVDISEEPPDGVPTHSGDSLVRGVL